MKSKNAQPTPPKHLRPETAAWWKQVVPEYDLESHHQRLLTKACEAWDRSDEAREAIAKHGSVLKTDLVRPATDPKSQLSETRDSRLLGWSVNSALMLRSPSSHVLCLCELTVNANQKAQPNKRRGSQLGCMCLAGWQAVRFFQAQEQR
jgi:phage terminase small subunit